MRRAGGGKTVARNGQTGFAGKNRRLPPKAAENGQAPATKIGAANTSRGPQPMNSPALATLRAAADIGAAWGSAPPELAAAMIADELDALMHAERFTPFQLARLSELSRAVRVLVDRLEVPV